MKKYDSENSLIPLGRLGTPEDVRARRFSLPSPTLLTSMGCSSLSMAASLPDRLLSISFAKSLPRILCRHGGSMIS